MYNYLQPQLLKPIDFTNDDLGGDEGLPFANNGPFLPPDRVLWECKNNLFPCTSVHPNAAQHTRLSVYYPIIANLFVTAL